MTGAVWHPNRGRAMQLRGALTQLQAVRDLLQLEPVGPFSMVLFGHIAESGRFLPIGA
jgi:hypothetical protein